MQHPSDFRAYQSSPRSRALQNYSVTFGELSLTRRVPGRNYSCPFEHPSQSNSEPTPDGPRVNPDAIAQRSPQLFLLTLSYQDYQDRSALSRERNRLEQSSDRAASPFRAIPLVRSGFLPLLANYHKRQFLRPLCSRHMRRDRWSAVLQSLLFRYLTAWLGAGKRS